MLYNYKTDFEQQLIMLVLYYIIVQSCLTLYATSFLITLISIGVKMKVLVYDSGISEEQKKSIKVTDLGFGVIDEAKHGSVVCDIISLLAPSARIESVKILDSDNSTTLNVLINALKYGLNSDCDIICLALSVECENNCSSLREVMRKLDESGKIVVCSNMNRTDHSLPAAYDSVIGCRTQFNAPDSRIYVKGRDIQSSIPVLIVWRIIDGSFVRLTGNSLSCAVMAAETAYLAQERNLSSRTEVENALAVMKWNDYRFYRYSSVCEESDNCEMLNDTFEKIQTIARRYNIKNNQPLYMIKDTEKFLNELHNDSIFSKEKMILQHYNLESCEALAKFICKKNNKGVQI